MRWLRRLLVVLIGIPVLAVIGLLGAGQRDGAGRNVEGVTIARPPAQVFRHLAEAERLKKWAGLVAIEGLGDGSLRPGERFHAIALVRAQRIVIDGEVTASEPDRYLALTLRSAPDSALGFSRQVQNRLENRGDRTRLTVTLDTHYYGLVAKLLEPLITRAAQRQLEANLDRLRREVEADSARSGQGS
jgi:uncharacterized protein YndB with AHSA1/START domain